MWEAKIGELEKEAGFLEYRHFVDNELLRDRIHAMLAEGVQEDGAWVKGPLLNTRSCFHIGEEYASVLAIPYDLLQFKDSEHNMLRRAMQREDPNYKPNFQSRTFRPLGFFNFEIYGLPYTRYNENVDEQIWDCVILKHENRAKDLKETLFLFDAYSRKIE